MHLSALEECITIRILLIKDIQFHRSPDEFPRMKDCSRGFGMIIIEEGT